MMAATDLLQHAAAERPIIYAYSDTRFPGMLKVGYTARPIEVRMKEHYPTLVPGQSWHVELIRPAMRPRLYGYQHPRGRERGRLRHGHHGADLQESGPAD
ncbi:MAG: GIY-YIG nuclease family protein [Bacteroides sp.]